jgi:hypothetical protein
MRHLSKVCLMAVLAILVSGAVASSASATTWVDWGSFPDLPRDRIELSETPNAVGADEIELELTMSSDIWMWKALDVRGWNNGRIGWAPTDSNYRGPSRTTIPVRDAQKLILVRGGFLGVYTEAYTLDHDQLAAKAGSRMTFHWQRD